MFNNNKQIGSYFWLTKFMLFNLHLRMDLFEFLIAVFNIRLKFKILKGTKMISVRLGVVKKSVRKDLILRAIHFFITLISQLEKSYIFWSCKYPNYQDLLIYVLKQELVFQLYQEFKMFGDNYYITNIQTLNPWEWMVKLLR